MNSAKPKTTIQDLIDRANGGLWWCVLWAPVMDAPHPPVSAAACTSRVSDRTPPVLTPPRQTAAGGDGDAPSQALVPTSPRSLEACLRLGLDPLELAYAPLSAFKRAGESAELTARRHAHHEALRQVGGAAG